jgi:hypothetical protein
MDEIKLKEAIAELVKNGDKAALAQLMVEWIQPQHITTDYISLLLNSKALNKGDSLVKKIRKGLKVHTLVPGSIHLAHEITTSERLNYILDGADIKVTANQWELDNGDIGTVGEIRTEMMAKLRDYYLGKVFTALSTIWTPTNTPLNYTTGATLTATMLKNAIDRINQTTGGVKAVVGLRSALTPITTFGAGYTDGTGVSQVVPENIREIMSTGWLGRYYGAPIIALEQVYNNPDDYTPLLPADKILVIGNKVGDFITYGEVKSKEWTDMEPTPPQWYLELYQEFGMVIDNADGVYVIKIA